MIWNRSPNDKTGCVGQDTWKVIFSFTFRVANGESKKSLPDSTSCILQAAPKLIQTTYNSICSKSHLSSNFQNKSRGPETKGANSIPGSLKPWGSKTTYIYEINMTSRFKLLVQSFNWGSDDQIWSQPQVVLDWWYLNLQIVDIYERLWPSPSNLSRNRERPFSET